MIKRTYKSVANISFSIFASFFVPVFLIVSISALFKTEIFKKEEKPPIILEMASLSLPQSVQTQIEKKIVKEVPKPKTKPVEKPRIVEKKVVKELVEKKLVEKKSEISPKPVKEITPVVEGPIVEQVVEIDEKPEVTEPIQPALPTPVPIFKVTEAPQFLHKEELVYPESMRSTGKTGVVKLSVLIGKEGNVHQVKVLKSGGKAFDEAAKRALSASTFIPAKIGNEFVAVELRVPVKFRLL